MTDAPLDSEGTREFMQQRVELYARVLLVFGALVQMIVRWTATAAPGQDYTRGADWTANAHLAILGICALAWLRVRTRQCSQRELELLELACALAPASFSFAALWQAPPSVSPALINLIGANNILGLRAVLVPSTGRRTAIIGSTLSIALVIWTYAQAAMHAGGANIAPPHVQAVAIATWCTMAVILETLASHTIFGLRQRVREAARIGQYSLLRKIGEGGMGVVYEAQHALLRRRTALKLLPPERAGEQSIARFEREVQLTAALTHPHTIAIYDYGRSADGVFYYAMEFLDGIDLQDLLDRGGAQHPGLVAQILEQVCSALAEAHSVGLIHRDIKPANILLCERGGVLGFAKVVDFGLVKRVEAEGRPAESAASNSLSGVHAIVGTPHYMAPESITNPSGVDARCDLYAVGALAYALLTGVPPFEGATVVEVCFHHLHSTALPPSSRLGSALPAALERLVLQCLEKDPQRRPASAQALASSLAALRTELGWTPELAHGWWSKCRAFRKTELGEQFRSTRKLTVALKAR